MNPFTFSAVAKLHVEVGAAIHLVSHCERFAARRVLVVTDAGIIRAGLLIDTVTEFANQDVQLCVFDKVEADPSEATVLQAVDVAKAQEVDVVIGFGGGSAMDVAKLVAVLAHRDNQQSLADMYGVDQLSGPRLPLIQVPTTAGTGSEVTPIAIITTGGTTKAGVVSSTLLPDVAVLDANLTRGLPAHVTAATGIDAMVHAIEAFTSKVKKNPISDMFALEALRLLSDSVRVAVKDGNDLQAREKALLGANLAGQAFANAPVAAVHALAYPLGGHFHIPHGLSNALVLPHVMRFNLPACATAYAQLAEVMIPAQVQAEMDHEAKANTLIDWLAELVTECGLPDTLSDCNVPQSSLAALAGDAMLQQRLLINNPREVTEQDALAIYQAAYQ
ncbi:iron-containing alcohol dehydrogenase [Aestuariibacter halophilus]|uniref:Iron-containing alcohol dehydrogenase n=1 Tax=Fluctibacter halophilus TaxID=226011 RepID=A0ABS8GE63_9ALTE|nr:iron-containing alcohol dehydrogenase [Aestuariibacter halophilus]MCC2617491.1 iron-containing alcohol dehydrogenase [Aestuariibacter halophilus]